MTASGRTSSTWAPSSTPATGTVPHGTAATPSVTSTSTRLVKPRNRATNGVGRAGPHLGGRPDLRGPTGVHHHHPMAETERLALVVGHVQDADAELGEQPSQLHHQPVAQRAVERPQRLVEHEQRRAGRQGPGQGHALALTTRQRRHRPPLGTVEAHQLQQLGHPGVAGGGAVAPHPQPEGHVVAHVAMGEQRVVLEHEPDPPPVGGHPGQVPSPQLDVAGVGLDQPGHRPQQGRLAAPARPQHGDHLAVAHHQVEVVEGGPGRPRVRDPQARAR